jgi:hypothetical protein
VSGKGRTQPAEVSTLVSEGQVSGHEVTCPWHGAMSAGAKSRRVLRRPRDGNRYRGRGVGTAAVVGRQASAWWFRLT